MKFRSLSIVVCMLVMACGCTGWARQQGSWAPVPGKIMTRWAAQVRPDSVHNDYPRPQMVRDQWTCLNGLWDYAIRPKDADRPTDWDGKILVPFCAESALSGVGKTVGPDNRLWYRRTFDRPRGAGGRVLLHFGAVDWEARVWVNGRPIGQHRGGYDPFTFDITDALKPDGPQEIVVSVWDPTNQGPQPRGKQVLRPHGIWYTAVTGIWQTVWLETVPAAYVAGLKITPDVDRSRVTVQVDATGSDTKNLDVQVRVPTGLFSAQQKQGRPGNPIVVDLPKARLWSPDDPFLYDLEVKLLRSGKTIDRVKSYFGMRKIAVAKDQAGINRLFLNNKPLFQYGPLDQGWWPDGLYTAPSDEALRYDIEVLKKIGCNMMRKHVKIEPRRFYYWCDKLGLLVWQDMPSGDRGIRSSDPDLKRTPESARIYEHELHRMIETFYNHPSIVMWVPFNEGWGQFDTPRIVSLIKQWDPTRLVDNASGWTDRKVGDVIDIHRYPGPACPAIEPDRAAVLGEFGGLGLPISGHTWQDQANWGYRSYKTREELTNAYLNLIARLRGLIGEGLAAAVYTQTTDVEIEVNGLMTYDRAIIKMDIDRITEAHHKLYGPPPILRTVVPSARDGRPGRWRYTTTQPGADWMKPGFDDTRWQQGAAGFGTEGTPGARIGTTWNGSDIWLRRAFTVPKIAGEVQLSIHHDEDAEVYINGVLAAKASGYTTDYVLVPISPRARRALRPGDNILAVHCKQTGGGQYIDVGLVETLEPGSTAKTPAKNRPQIGPIDYDPK